jgi:hypothetical protein
LEGAGAGGTVGFTVGGPVPGLIGAGIGGGINVLTGGGAADAMSNVPVVGPMLTGQAAAGDPSADRFVTAGWADSPEDFTGRQAQMQMLMGMGFDQTTAMQQAFGDTKGGQRAIAALGQNAPLSPAQEAAMLTQFIHPYTQQMRATQQVYSDALGQIPNLPAATAQSVATWAPLQRAMTDRQAANMEAAAALAPYYQENSAGGDFDAMLGAFSAVQ